MKKTPHLNIVDDPIAHSHSLRLIKAIQHTLLQDAHAMTFADFMQAALYMPQLGYYTAGAHKIGKGGDFITAPEISNLFSQILAKQCADVLQNLKEGDILEFGAGSGQMAATILLALETQDMLPAHYYILEVSPDLQARQRSTLAKSCAHLLEKIVWLDRLPANFQGVMLANEVLDAMPVALFRWDGERLQEGMVSLQNQTFVPNWGEPSANLEAAFATLSPYRDAWQLPYESEINLLLPGWIKSVAQSLKQGVLLCIDYGFARHEYYHPQRKTGTLMCHYQHQAHMNPYILCGLQDITAHVDFTALVEAGAAAGLTLEGYTTQAHFLLNCGIHELIEKEQDQEIKWRLSQELKLLTLPSEMGEFFKVMGLGKNVEGYLQGFDRGDISHGL